MAKRKPKAAQWLKVEGIGWVKAKVTVCRAKSWTRGVGVMGGWEPHARVDMSRRGEVHVTRVNGPLLKEAI